MYDPLASKLISRPSGVPGRNKGERFCPRFTGSQTGNENNTGKSKKLKKENSLLKKALF
jgi:hypothetical protein